MRLHQKEMAKPLLFLKYLKLINKRHYYDHDILSFKTTLKEARWSWIDFSSIEIISEKCIKMTSIISLSKLYQHSTSKWRRNWSILTCQLNFDIDLTCWVCGYNIRTKLVLVSTQNYCCFNVVLLLIKW